MTIKFLELVKEKARAKPARIVFPETFDQRTLRAIAKIVEEKTAKPVLIGDPEKLKQDFNALGLSSAFPSCNIINMTDPSVSDAYAKELFNLRKEKGLTLDQAKTLIKNINYFGVMVVQLGEAEGLISGANCPTADTLRPALQIISAKEKFHKVSGFFFMVMEQRLMLFADCAVNIAPDAHELAEIAIDTAETAKRFGIEPRIAMLSFSTNASTRHPNSDRVREAAKMVNHFRPDLVCEGEMQVDAALVPEICAKKFPGSRVAGNANILIFPNLDAANIAYKLVQRLGHAEAIGPILQGLQKPINDLSRGCSVDDIVNLAAITSVEAEEAEVKTKKISGL